MRVHAASLRAIAVIRAAKHLPGWASAVCAGSPI
jgi:hypothetical protein